MNTVAKKTRLVELLAVWLTDAANDLGGAAKRAELRQIVRKAAMTAAETYAEDPFDIEESDSFGVVHLIARFAAAMDEHEKDIRLMDKEVDTKDKEPDDEKE